MFDISFTELLIIGVVALIVIGPEKLPKVARTAGHLLGRAQRYVTDVKRDIKQEMDSAGAGSLGDLKKEMEDAAQAVKRSVDDTTRSLRNPLDEAKEAMRKAEAAVNDTMTKLPGSTEPAESGDAPADQSAQQAPASEAAQVSPPAQPAESTASSSTAETAQTAHEPAKPEQAPADTHATQQQATSQQPKPPQPGQDAQADTTPPPAPSEVKP